MLAETQREAQHLRDEAGKLEERVREAESQRDDSLRTAREAKAEVDRSQRTALTISAMDRMDRLDLEAALDRTSGCV